ncbi:MAG: hypothetical protein GY943_15045 [Chloroflexi bacterium]|nr:hypothetical protein [Chloroflexota bacterium]
MDFIQKQPGISAIVAFLLGLIIGLPILGWYVFPVEWVDTPQDNLLRSVAELYSLDGNNADKVKNTLSAWSPADATAATCNLRSRSNNVAEQQRLDAVAFVLSGQGCAAIAAAPPDGATGDAGVTDAVGTEPESSSNLGPIVILGLLLLVFAAAILFVIRRRNAMVEETNFGGVTAVPESAPMTGADSDLNAIPLARFQSSYAHGRDTYDDSFSIENTNGDFLGECGVGISESIGTDSPKNVTAFEVWLFDKNDIRTVTKVVMSDHAFFDEALKAKLAPKGEPFLARENEVIVLETATLIINAEIKSLNYGEGTLPPQSFFDAFTVELSAWAKEGDYGEPDVQGRVDEILDY